MAIPEELRRRLEALPDTAYDALMAWLDEYFRSRTESYAAARQRAREIMREGLPIDWENDKVSRDDLHDRH